MRAPVVTQKHARKLRRAMTLPEVVLWSYLRRRGLSGLHFRKQHPVGPYILDFYCADHQLCIEVDGAVHNSPDAAQHGERRTAWLAEQDIRVLRFSAQDVLKDQNLPGVFTVIEAATRLG